jgi:hypothetical protein
MAEIVHLRDGAPVELRPCPSWCTGEAHFHEDLVVDPDDGFHHYGPEAATPTFDRICIDDPEIIVTAVVKAWTCPLDAEPGPARVQLALAPGGVITELSAELTPGQARDVARTLLELAAVAEGTSGQ